MLIRPSTGIAAYDQLVLLYRLMEAKYVCGLTQFVLNGRQKIKSFGNWSCCKLTNVCKFYLDVKKFKYTKCWKMEYVQWKNLIDNVLSTTLDIGWMHISCKARGKKKLFELSEFKYKYLTK